MADITSFMQQVGAQPTADMLAALQQTPAATPQQAAPLPQSAVLSTTLSPNVSLQNIADYMNASNASNIMLTNQTTAAAQQVITTNNAQSDAAVVAVYDEAQKLRESGIQQRYADLQTKMDELAAAKKAEDEHDSTIGFFNSFNPAWVSKSFRLQAKVEGLKADIEKGLSQQQLATDALKLDIAASDAHLKAQETDIRHKAAIENLTSTLQLGVVSEKQIRQVVDDAKYLLGGKMEVDAANERKQARRAGVDDERNQAIALLGAAELRKAGVTPESDSGMKILAGIEKQFNALPIETQQSYTKAGKYFLGQAVSRTGSPLEAKQIPEGPVADAFKTAIDFVTNTMPQITDPNQRYAVAQKIIAEANISSTKDIKTSDTFGILSQIQTQLTTQFKQYQTAGKPAPKGLTAELTSVKGVQDTVQKLTNEGKLKADEPIWNSPSNLRMIRDMLITQGYAQNEKAATNQLQFALHKVANGQAMLKNVSAAAINWANGSADKPGLIYEQNGKRYNLATPDLHVLLAKTGSGWFSSSTSEAKFMTSGADGALGDAFKSSSGPAFQAAP